MKKRGMAWILCMGIAAAALSGCGAKSAETGTAASAPVQESAGGAKKAEDGGSKKEAVKLKGLVYKSAQTDSVDTMQWLKDAQEAVGVEIEWEEISSDWDSIKSTLLASGDIPDIMMGTDAFSNSDFLTFQGLFEDMAPLIANNAPNIQKMFQEHPQLKQLASMEGGEIYGIPKYQRFWPVSWYSQYINQSWLTRLGLKVPTTWEELYTVLKAFKEQDANGNGDPNDEIPMNFVINVPGSCEPYQLLSGFGFSFDLFQSTYGFYVEDGIVKNFLNTPEYKQFCEYYHRLYSEGLIYSSAFTNDDASFTAAARQQAEDGYATVGYLYAWTVTDIVGSALADQYVSIPPLKVSGSQEKPPVWTYEFDQLNIKPNTVVMSSECSDKEAAMRFIDQLYDPEVSLQILYGDLGKNIRKNEDGSYTVLSPKEAGDTQGYDAGAWKWKTTLADMGPGCISDSMQVDLPEDGKMVAEDRKPIEEALAGIDMENNALHDLFLKFTDEETNQLALIKSNIESLCQPQFADWTVNGGIDAGWDTYCQSFDATGVQEAIVMYQKAYDSYKGK